MMSTYLIFINEEWHLFVIDYWNFKGWPYMIFFIIILIVCQLFIMKMFMALLINHFCRSTNMKYLIKYSEEDKFFYPKFWKKKIKQFYNNLKPFLNNYLKILSKALLQCIRKPKIDVIFFFFLLFKNSFFRLKHFQNKEKS